MLDHEVYFLIHQAHEVETCSRDCLNETLGSDVGSVPVAAENPLQE